MSEAAAEQLERSAEVAWDERWRFVQDSNGDGVVTTADFGGWAEWLFFAPGDWIILGLMKSQPDVAVFFEMTPDLQSGLLSGLISLGVWLAVVVFLAALFR
jgi:hypothetical protein